MLVVHFLTTPRAWM